tara:strand:- start:1078 stop:2184 length:1107 start_codon:yes stop_codon:yes gene_type:complete
MEKNQKKLIVFMPSMEGGGVEKNIIILSNYLRNHIDKITLITFDNKFNKFFDKKIKILNSKKNLKKNYSKYYKYFICLKLLCQEVIKFRNSSVISFQANVYCIILSKIVNFDLIIRSNSSPTGWTKNKLKNFIFKKFFQIPKFIIVNSNDFKKELNKRFNVSSKIIYNPLNKNEIMQKSKEKVSVKIFQGKKTLKLINVARFTDQKDHLTLLNAFKHIPKEINARLLLMGYGNNKKLILDFIKDNSLINVIKVIDYQNNPYKYIAKADFFILSSIYEGLPNVLLEAMTLKKLIISSNCPTGPKEILKNGKYGFLFKVGDHKDLLQKIIWCSKNKKINKIKIKKGHESLERFDYNLNCNKYLKLINKII